MSTRTALYALTITLAALTLPAAASARPLYDPEPAATPAGTHAASSGPSPLLFVAAALAIVLVIVAVRVIRVRPAPVKA